MLDDLLDSDILRSLPTEEDLPDCDEMPVDNELQLLAPMLLRGILSYIWDDRLDWFFGVNLGLYAIVNEPAIGPDAFLSLGVDRVRPNDKLRLSYLVYREGVMPQWVLEVISKKLGKEYDDKFRKYAELGVLYYTIYNPSHYRRDRHDAFEVYRLENGEYIKQIGNPVWMPELGLGIGHERGTHERHRRDWLYWYNENGDRYPVPENVIKEERLLREREELRRIQAEERLTEEVRSRLEEQEQRFQIQQQYIQVEQQLQGEQNSRQAIVEQLEQERNRFLEIAEQLEQERLQTQQALQQERRSIALKMLQDKLSLEQISRFTEFTIAQLQEMQSH